MVLGARDDFGPALLEGLAELGPVEPFSGDLSLELGVSVWLRRTSTSLVEARAMLLEVRSVILAVCELDASTEPVPMVGRSPGLDVVNLVAYLADVLRRAAVQAETDVRRVVDQVVAALPAPADEALGA
jgi:hypothetical protein